MSMLHLCLRCRIKSLQRLLLALPSASAPWGTLCAARRARRLAARVQLAPPGLVPAHLSTHFSCAAPAPRERARRACAY